MSTEYVSALKFQLTHGLEFEKKYITSTMNKMFKVELDMVMREMKPIEITLSELEQRHNMSSDIFCDKFNAGELGDDREYIKWYAYKDTHIKLTERANEITKLTHA
ncbi:MAG TPA: hypothetical protein C5S51_02425 [Methanosarcinaceae archaeon]|nr:hypothetical protein [Methanosarcinaceae archaeon]